MKRISFLSALVVAWVIACNTAEIKQAGLIDAGPACDLRPAVVTCDAGAYTLGACSGAVTVALDIPDASATIGAGSYALGCEVTFYHADPASSDCLPYHACTCVSASEDAGAGPAAGDAGEDSGVVGAVAPGSWSCQLPTP